MVRQHSGYVGLRLKEFLVYIALAIALAAALVVGRAAAARDWISIPTGDLLVMMVFHIICYGVVFLMLRRGRGPSHVFGWIAVQFVGWSGAATFDGATFDRDLALVLTWLNLFYWILFFGVLCFGLRKLRRVYSLAGRSEPANEPEFDIAWRPKISIRYFAAIAIAVALGAADFQSRPEQWRRAWEVIYARDVDGQWFYYDALISATGGLILLLLAIWLSRRFSGWIGLPLYFLIIILFSTGLTVAADELQRLVRWAASESWAVRHATDYPLDALSAGRINHRLVQAAWAGLLTAATILLIPLSGTRVTRVTPSTGDT